jgi:hypothetical protein
MPRLVTSMLALGLTTLALWSLPGAASAEAYVVKNAYGDRLGTAVVTNRSRGEGVARTQLGEPLCRVRKVAAARWKGSYLTQVEGAGPTVIRRFATGTRWRIRFASLTGWWRLVPRGNRWVLRSPGSAMTWASVSRRCPAPLAALATLSLNGP